MDNIKLYEIDPLYVKYISQFAEHAFHNKQPGQQNERKYIGVILTVNGMDYFAPLSSYKEKHLRMPETIDFIKVKRYAVININNMFPVPSGLATYVDISKEKNPKYKSLENEIISVMEANDFLLDDEEDLYESDTKMYHKAFRFKLENLKEVE